MTTLMEREAPAGMPRGSDRDEDKSSRLSRWRASWRVALRMAKRDAWRYKGRSILVLVMVALPVGVLVGTLAFATDARRCQQRGAHPDLARQRPGDDPGSGRAGRLADRRPRRRAGPATATATPAKATRDARLRPRDSLGSAANVAALQRITGGTVVPVGDADDAAGPRREAQPRASTVTTFDAGSVDLGTKAELVSGRWPAAAGRDRRDALRHQPRHARPRHRHAAHRPASRSTSPSSASPTTSTAGAASPTPSRPARSTADAVLDWQYLLLRDTGVPYSEVKALNAYGLQVTSAEALRNPPAASRAAADACSRCTTTPPATSRPWSPSAA